MLTGVDVVEVPGATGWYDTDYEGKRDACLRTLADGADVFLLHVEATDEAGHAGDLGEKLAALEAWDARILAGLVEGLDALGPWRLLLLPDHPTPVRLKTHTTDAVPYLLVDSDARRAWRRLLRGRHRVVAAGSRPRPHAATARVRVVGRPSRCRRCHRTGREHAARCIGSLRTWWHDVATT